MNNEFIYIEWIKDELIEIIQKPQQISIYLFLKRFEI